MSAAPMLGGGQPAPPPLVPFDRDALVAAASAWPDLRNRPQWVCWRAEPKVVDGKAKWNKIPIDPRTGQKARTNDPSTWSTFTDALDACAKRRLAGIGFVFSADDPYCGIDLDHCLGPDGSLEPWAAAIVVQLDSYCEVTPSGTGLHVVVRGKLPAGGRKRGAIECYDAGRFFTFTGRRLEGTKPGIEDRQSELEQFHRESFGDELAPTKLSTPPSATVPDLGDEILLGLARSSKNGAKFSSLWAGTLSEHGGDASRADLALCHLLAFWTRRDAARIDALFRQSGLMRPKWDERRGDRTYGQRTIDTAITHCTETYSGPTPLRGPVKDEEAAPSVPVSPAPEDPPTADLDQQPPQEKPQIIIVRDLAAMVDKGLEVLRRDKGLYQRGGILAHVVRDDAGATWLRAPETPRIAPLDKTGIRLRLSRGADFGNLVEDPEGNMLFKLDLPPIWLAEPLASLGEWPGVRPLAGMTESPCLRPDGSILDRPGYDPPTGLLHLPCGTFPPVPNRPTRAEAEQAAKALLEPFEDFRLVGPEDRAALLAALLTPIATPMFDSCAPLFAVRAPTPGSGKSLICDVIGIIALGRTLPRMVLPERDEETDKRILSIGLAGYRAVCLDNADGEIASEPLAIALTTADEFEGRLLGQSKQIRVRLRLTWFCNGNALTFRGGLARRALPIDIDTQAEHPEDRVGPVAGSRWKHQDLKRHATAQRPRLLVQALTILRAFHVAGRPGHGLPLIGGYEAWDECVRGAVMWATGADAAATRKRIRTEGDSDLDGLRALLVQWREHVHDQAATVAEIIRATDSPTANDDFRAALVAVAADKDGKVSSRRLGKYLARHCGRFVGGLRVVQAGDRSGVKLWTLEAVGLEESKPTGTTPMDIEG